MKRSLLILLVALFATGVEGHDKHEDKYDYRSIVLSSQIEDMRAEQHLSDFRRRVDDTRRDVEALNLRRDLRRRAILD